MRTLYNPMKYGVTEAKKAELDLLTNDVLFVQDEVEQLQASATSLTEKSNKLQTLLKLEEAEKENTLKNKDLLNALINNIVDLIINSSVTLETTIRAKDSIKIAAVSIDIVVNKLIYSAEVINKLSNLVIRKKAQNPLISDELVSKITAAGEDANNAVALSITALNSVFASQATTIEADGAMSLEVLQAIKLFEFLTGLKIEPSKEDVANSINLIDKALMAKKELKNKNEVKDEFELFNAQDETFNENLRELINKAYRMASKKYTQTLGANTRTLNQLSDAQTKLSIAQIKLNSLQSGLEAANAAALAS